MGHRTRVARHATTKGEESAILSPIPCDCGTRAASFDAPQDRALEGHFACGSGLLIESDFLGRSCATKTASRDATISLPNVPADWQRDGFLDSPAWSNESHRDPNQEAKPDWDVTSGITNNRSTALNHPNLHGCGDGSKKLLRLPLRRRRAARRDDAAMNSLPPPPGQDVPTSTRPYSVPPLGLEPRLCGF